MLKDEVFTENTRHGVDPKNTGRDSNEDVVLSTDLMVLLGNGFPRLNIYVRPLCFGNKWHTSILNYRSVSPIQL